MSVVLPTPRGPDIPTLPPGRLSTKCASCVPASVATRWAGVGSSASPVAVAPSKVIKYRAWCSRSSRSLAAARQTGRTPRSIIACKASQAGRVQLSLGHGNRRIGVRFGEQAGHNAVLNAV